MAMVVIWCFAELAMDHEVVGLISAASENFQLLFQNLFGDRALRKRIGENNLCYGF